VGAALIDFAPVAVIFLLVAATIGTWETGDGGTRIEVRNGAALVFILLVVGYHFLFEATFGATIGKLLVGLRVVEVTGRPATTSQMFGRNLMRIVDFLPVFYLVGFVAAVANERNARLGDLVAKTAVVRTRDIG
jgi:uncharacterized RDD family membrane protein YckC